MSTNAEIHAAIWAHATRTVDASGPAASNGNWLDDLRFAVWTFGTRTVDPAIEYNAPAATVGVFNQAPTWDHVYSAPAAAIDLQPQAPTWELADVYDAPAATVGMQPQAPTWDHVYSAPAAAIDLQPQAPTWELAESYDAPAATVGMQAQAPTWDHVYSAPAAAIDLQPQAPTWDPGIYDAPAVTVGTLAQAPTWDAAEPEAARWLDRGQDWLRGLRTATTVSYTRGAVTNAQVRATQADTQAIADAGRVINDAATVDWLIDRVDLVLASAAVEPQPGDRIERVYSHGTERFKVVAAAGGEPGWRWHGRDGQTFRIHTVRT